MSYHYTFDNFVPGNNTFAYQALVDVSEHLGVFSNLIFIYGPSGVGKTHLLLAAARKLKENIRLNVVSTTAKQMVDELIATVNCGDPEAFRGRHHGADVLLVDDIQYFTGRWSTAEDFCSIFDALIEYGKTVVIASDRHPHEIWDIPSCLQERLLSGTVIAMEVPDTDTRREIARSFAAGYRSSWPDEVFNIIAETTHNGFQLKGMVRTLMLYEDTNGHPLTTIEAKQLIPHKRKENCMCEINVIPGLYYVGKDIPAGSYVISLASESEYANVSLEKPIHYSWFLKDPHIQICLRLEDKGIFRLDRPVTIRPAEPIQFA